MIEMKHLVFDISENIDINKLQELDFRSLPFIIDNEPEPEIEVYDNLGNKIEPIEISENVYYYPNTNYKY